MCGHVTLLDDVHFYNKIWKPGLGQMWGPVIIFMCQIMSNPRLRPRKGGGGGVSRNNDRRISDMIFI